MKRQEGQSCAIFWLAGCKVELRTNSAEFLARLSQLYYARVSDHGDQNGDRNGDRAESARAQLPTFSVHHTSNGAEWRVIDAGSQLHVKPNLDEALYKVDRSFGAHAATRRGDCVHLHGGAMTNGRQTLLLIGPPRMGKSTLLAGLASLGFVLVSEELIFLDVARLSLIPFQRSFLLREDVLASLRAFWPAAAVCFSHTKFDGKRRYVVDPASYRQLSPGARAKPSLLFFPRYAPEERTRLRALDPAEVLERLTQEGMNLEERTTERLCALIDVAHALPGYELTMASLEEGVSSIRATLASCGAPVP